MLEHFVMSTVRVYVQHFCLQRNSMKLGGPVTVWIGIVNWKIYFVSRNYKCMYIFYFIDIHKCIFNSTHICFYIFY
jgi:hypothetical protein